MGMLCTCSNIAIDMAAIIVAVVEHHKDIDHYHQYPLIIYQTMLTMSLDKRNHL